MLSFFVGATERLGLAPNRRGLDRLADVAVDLGELFLQEECRRRRRKVRPYPTLRMWAQAQAAVRIWDCEDGGRTKLCPGLASTRRARAESVARYSFVKRA